MERFWDLDISTGHFTVISSGIYKFVISGTALQTDAILSLVIKSGKLETSEKFYEFSTGYYKATETAFKNKFYVANQYGSGEWR